MRALIVTDQGVQDQEFIYPFYRLQEAKFDVTVAAGGPGEFHGIQGVRFEANAAIDDEAEVIGDYDLLVVPGGVKAMERLRLSDAAVYLVAEMYKRGKVVASICSGAQMLISAGLCKGRVISCYPAMRIDVENAGGTFHPGPAVVSDRICSAPHYRNLGAWMATTLQEVKRRA